MNPSAVTENREVSRFEIRMQLRHWQVLYGHAHIEGLTKPSFDVLNIILSVHVTYMLKNEL